MILTLALLTLTQLSPQTSSARLLPEESVQGFAGAPPTTRLPGLQRAWVPWVVAGALTGATAVGLILFAVATHPGGIAGIALALLGGLIASAITLVCGIISAVIGAENGEIRRRAQKRPRVPPESAAAAVTLQPTALALRF